MLAICAFCAFIGAEPPQRVPPPLQGPVAEVHAALVLASQGVRRLREQIDAGKGDIATRFNYAIAREHCRYYMQFFDGIPADYCD